MTGAQVIVLAMPVFLLAMALEFAIGLARRRNTYRLNDTLSSLGLGAMSQVVDAFGTLFKLAMYTWVFQHLALFELSASSAWVWVGALPSVLQVSRRWSGWSLVLPGTPHTSASPTMRRGACWTN